MKNALALCLALLVIAAVGCGSGVSTHPVSGVVTMDGKPLADASIQFTPEQPDGQVSKLNAPGSHGVTDSEGRFTLEVTTTGDEGAIAGLHRVSITMATGDEDEESDEDMQEEKMIPAKYNYESELTFQVKAGDNSANFDLKSK